MNKSIIILFLIITSFTSCVDVIEVDVPTAPPRLVIEASIDWEKETLGNKQTIKLSLSSAYFDTDQIHIVKGAKVRVIQDSDKTEFIFKDQNDGNYTTASFTPILNQSYTLEVIYNNETYLAKETLTPVVAISEITQSTENGFDDEAIEVNVTFQDPEDEENYYLYKFQKEGDKFAELFDDSDEFTNGNEMTFTYERTSDNDDDENNDDELQPGDIVYIHLHGTSQQYYNYIRLLIEQTENSGGIFSTTPAEIKGNCINITNSDNYAFGYFRLTEVDYQVYTIQ